MSPLLCRLIGHLDTWRGIGWHWVRSCARCSEAL